MQLVCIVYYAAFLSEYLRTKDLYRTILHAEKERYAEGITVSDLETAISVGEILEDYANDPRGHSSLILEYSQRRKS